MTTTVKVSCNGPNYRTVVEQQGKDQVIVTQVDGEKVFNVGQGTALTVREEYGEAGVFKPAATTFKSPLKGPPSDQEGAGDRAGVAPERDRPQTRTR